MKAAFDRRESGVCPLCNSNYRNRQLARALVDVYGRNGEGSVAELTRSEHFRSLRILGIDLDSLLMLEECPGFSRSNYITSLIPALGLPDNGLPFGDGWFDLILASDTLEHTPAYRRALREISRVLKPDGRFVTVQPVILSRRTLRRCVVDDAGLVRHLLPTSSRRLTWNRPCTSTMCHLTTTPGWLSARRSARPGPCARERRDGGSSRKRPGLDLYGRCRCRRCFSAGS
jgi:SAM-dependent methyltransferase